MAGRRARRGPRRPGTHLLPLELLALAQELDQQAGALQVVPQPLPALQLLLGGLELLVALPLRGRTRKPQSAWVPRTLPDTEGGGSPPRSLPRPQGPPRPRGPHVCPGHLPPSPRAPARAAPRLRLTGGAPAGHRAARSGAEASPPPSPAAHVLKPVPAAASDHSGPGRHGPIPTHTLVSAAGGKAVLPVPPRPWGMPVASASPVTRGTRSHPPHSSLWTSAPPLSGGAETAEGDPASPPV